MEASGGADAAKASQPVGKHGAAGTKVTFRPFDNRLSGETRYWRQLDSAGMSAVVHRDRRHELHFVSDPRPALPLLRSPPS